MFYGIATKKEEKSIKSIVLGNLGSNRIEARNEANQRCKENSFKLEGIYKYK